MKDLQMRDVCRTTVPQNFALPWYVLSHILNP
jgi:hypothetical protein